MQHPDKPPEIEDLAGLEARVEAWLKHCNTEYTRAETRFLELQRLHCGEAKTDLDRWGKELGEAIRLHELLRGRHNGLRCARCTRTL